MKNENSMKKLVEYNCRVMQLECGYNTDDLLYDRLYNKLDGLVYVDEDKTTE